MTDLYDPNDPAALGRDPTVADLLGDKPIAIAPITPPRLEETPEFPKPGIYFGMDEDYYHSIPALSQSGMKKLASSPMLFWANSWLNPERERRETTFMNLGKAYHCRIMEGREEFARRFAPELTIADLGEGLLVSTDEIKAAIEAAGAKPRHKVETGEIIPGSMQPDEVVTRAAGKQDWLDQLALAGGDPGEKPTNDSLKAALRALDIEPRARVETGQIIPGKMSEDKPALRSAVKADHIEHLLSLDPTARIWDNELAKYGAANAGKIHVPADAIKRIEISARMIELDGELRHAFSEGWAEVSLFWYCPQTGCPMKARLDYLKPKAIVDLKSFGNQKERPIDRAIAMEIAYGHYNLQVVNYLEGVAAVKELIRQHGASAIFHRMDEGADRDAAIPQRDWAMKWAAVKDRPNFLFVFQQTGIAPVTRGAWFPIGGTTWTVTLDINMRMKRKFVEFAAGYGADPWLDIAPIMDLADEDIPQFSTDL